MTDILFGQSYFLRFDPKLYAAMQPYPPLGTMFAASYMREQGYTVALFDAMLADSEAEWDVALQTAQPRYAVLFEDNFNYLSKMCLLNMRAAAFNMIDMAKQRDIPVIVCGADATDHYTKYLDAGADYVLRGEGEQTLRELLLVLEGQSAMTLNGVTGLAYRADATPGETVITAPRPVMKTLDDMPFPAWDLVDVPRYRDLWRTHHGYYSVNMVTTRGCPFHCNWCAKPIWGQRYNVRSAQEVAAELEWLHETLQPDHIWFADDIMGLKPGWIQAFADEIERRDIRTPFKCLSRADLLVKDDTVEAMHRAGAQSIWIGAESGSQKILDAMDKGTSVEQIYEARRKLGEVGIHSGFFLQFGYPGEDHDDIEATLQMVRDLLPDDIGISVSYPLPGTPFYERVKTELKTKTNWQDSEDLAMLYEGSFSTEFYRQLHRVVHKEFRARRTSMLLRRGKLSMVRPQSWRRMAAMVYHTLTIGQARRKLQALAVPNNRTPDLSVPMAGIS
jgi:anaerobic magnesium-protoporphyrin IX monomethyl ester cyclase